MNQNHVCAYHQRDRRPSLKIFVRLRYGEQTGTTHSLLQVTDITMSKTVAKRFPVFVCGESAALEAPICLDDNMMMSTC